MGKYWLTLFLCLGFLAPAQAQLFRVPFSYGRLARTGAEMFAHVKIQPVRTQQIYASARLQMRAPKSLLTRVPRSLVQVARLTSPTVLGTGFLFRSHNRLWVAMPYHLGGRVGQKRVVRVFDEEKGFRLYEVQIVASGNAGWSSADVSLAELPEEALSHGARPLHISQPQFGVPTYSLGYTAGPFGHGDLLPMRRDILSAEGFGLIGERYLPGDNVMNPYLVSGYCGSPVLQWRNGHWLAVGLHAGGCAFPGKPGFNRTFAINLSSALPPLLDSYLYPSNGMVSHSLSFRGWQVGRIAVDERVAQVKVYRGSRLIFSRELRNDPRPYSDVHSELALGPLVTQPGDKIVYEILNSRHKSRTLVFQIP